MLKQWIGSWLVGISLFASASMADANPHFISPDEVEIGMTGYAKTVVQGAEIEKFDVKVIGFADGGVDRQLVLIQVSGDVIDRTGGVVQGMSGSPVYLNGRLLGAIAYGYKFGDSSKCMVMPIEDMTKMWDMPDPLNNPLPSAIDIKKIKEEKEKKEAEAKAKEDTEAKTDTEDADASDEQTDKQADEQIDKQSDKQTAEQPAEQPADKADDEAAVDTADAVPLTTPVMVSGFSQGGFDRLKADLAPLNMVPYAANGLEGRVAKRDLEPGSSIGAVLMRGDFSIGALGTVTYVEGDKMVAFGHPFTQIGNSNYFLTNSEIFTTIDSLEAGFKVGATGAPIGIINQDRSSGIAGIVGKFPATIPMEITVSDRQNGIEKTFNVQTIHNEELSPAFLTAALCSAVERTIDRKGEGTAAMTFAIEARNMPGRIFERENMYYSANDIISDSADEFADMITQLMNNRFREIEVMKIKINVDVDANRRTATILEAVTDTPQVHPGETINFKVKLRPYRGEDIVEDVPYTVPLDHPGGEQEIIFRGGAIPNTTVMESIERHQTPETIKAIAESERKMTFEEILDKLSRRSRSNDIVIEENLGQVFDTFAEMEAQGKQRPEIPQLKTDGVDLLGVKKRIAEEAAKSVQKYPTLYIIDNQIETSITVVLDDKLKDGKKSDKKAKDDKVKDGKRDKKAADDKKDSKEVNDSHESAPQDLTEEKETDKTKK